METAQKRPVSRPRKVVVMEPPRKPRFRPVAMMMVSTLATGAILLGVNISYWALHEKLILAGMLCFGWGVMMINQMDAI